ncbi:MFS transporter [Gordonia amarae]|uniref:MFS transporter n=2 Tax=Gordonia amarae TaxID=36821 RepID=A0A857LR19_9ACTN|nr:MFS transporter [Gordonia amarae]MCS3880263.1 MFS family permease [Gordonia amarae]QHN18616.1 MFS transporter [Gordonia amarae]QHN23091.1 MFS transporter [Gordonia amarae]QHN31992.1 MFS transporter [Gordonia amarae]QHN40739.1 MFS transporter [Gordonia amarae]
MSGQGPACRDHAGTTNSRTLALHVHLPTGLLGVANGATAPIVVLAALAHGASVSQAGLVVAGGGLGMVAADLPAGSLVARIGERWSIALGSAVGVVGALLCVIDSSLLTLSVGVVLLGLAQAVWGLARQSYLTAVVPFGQRARAISTMAGMSRLGFFVGPFVTAAILGSESSTDTVGSGATDSGHLTYVFAVQLAMVLLAGILFVTMADPPHLRTPAGSLPIHTVAVRERGTLLRLGPGALALGAVRASRTVVLPLWAEHIGMSGAEIALAFGVAGALDVGLSYPAGVGLDRLGRRAMAVPSLLLYSVGLLCIPLATTETGVWIVAIAVASANGLTNGLIMTIGADASPADARPQFLAAWRLLHDAGSAGAPAAAGALAGIIGLAAASACTGLVGLAGTLVFAVFLPRRPRTAPEATAPDPRVSAVASR